MSFYSPSNTKLSENVTTLKLKYWEQWDKIHSFYSCHVFQRESKQFLTALLPLEVNPLRIDSCKSSVILFVPSFICLILTFNMLKTKLADDGLVLFGKISLVISLGMSSKEIKRLKCQSNRGLSLHLCCHR